MTASPHPALVTRDAAQRLPRLAFWLFCAAYLIPGVFGRDPWKNADLVAFGQMLALAQGRSSWWLPSLGGVLTGAALLPNWLGAGFIEAGSGWLSPVLAARIPFILLLALTLLGVWRAAYHLARSAAAQPLPMAFGGEAAPKDYARAIADSAVLALIATLGLLQLGHETTPELAQLAASASLLWAIAASAFRPRRARLGVVLSLVLLAGCGAPALAVAAGLAGGLGLGLCSTEWRSLRAWLILGAAAAALAAWPLASWAWRGVPLSADLWLRQLPRLLPWFLWPAWLLALWTMWRWRMRWRDAHLLLPSLHFLLGLVGCVAMGGSDRALMLGLPGLAVLAAFALPTLGRSAGAAIDWFSLFFFSLLGATIWFAWLALRFDGLPYASALIRHAGPGFVPAFDGLAVVLAALASLVWLWLVRWRTQRRREPLWTRLVLPAGGVALCWLLAMTLLLPALDHARSYRATIAAMAPLIAGPGCIAGPELAPTQVAALEVHAGRVIDARPESVSGTCRILLRMGKDSPVAAPAGWIELARIVRPTESGSEFVVVYRRAG